MTNYGCHSKPRSDGYLALDGWKMNESCEGESPNWIYIRDTMSRECRYDRQREDAKCEGCNRITTNE